MSGVEGRTRPWHRPRSCPPAAFPQGAARSGEGADKAVAFAHDGHRTAKADWLSQVPGCRTVKGAANSTPGRLGTARPCALTSGNTEIERRT